MQAHRSATIWLLNFCCRQDQVVGLRSILEKCQEPSLKIVDLGLPGQLRGSDLETLRKTSKEEPSLVFGLLDSRPCSGVQTLVHQLVTQSVSCPVILVLPEGESDDGLSLLTGGAADFIIPPLRTSEVLARLRRWLTPTSESQEITQQIKGKLGLGQIVGRSCTFATEIRKIPLLARCDASVLICGETGTGKELAARAIHYLSSRAAHPFVPVSCGAIPVELAESELFGHKAGAFTGARYERRGLVEEARAGTLFLDDVDGLPAAVQSKLLRFLEEKEYRVLGSSRTQKADVRVIAASNVSLLRAVEEGAFRRDLYYRLNVVALNLPPLRERAEDIPLLARHFVTKFAAADGRGLPDFNCASLTKLMLYDWPGNVRELEHVIRGAMILYPGPILREDDIELPGPNAREQESFKKAKALAVARFERRYICNLLLAHSGNISQAARSAGKNRRAFWELIRKHQIDVGSLRPQRA
ncbi:MAG: sigma-54-dependent Fis family transcriptional regulator [Acidobacteria bacterium]|nr:MAG: sigma-54-dependent Fis family transcriptional regulator [Acidobacteriota bacterium]